MLTPTSSSGKKTLRFTIRGMMAFILLIAIGLGVSLNTPFNRDPKAWRDRLIALHAFSLGFLIPLATALFYLIFAAPVVEPVRRRERTEMSFGLGCLLSTFVIGSLIFWTIVLTMVRD